MAGSWLSVVEGFGGMRVKDGVLSLEPQLPAAWESLAFKINFRGRVLTVEVSRDAVGVSNEGAPVDIVLCGTPCRVGTRITHKIESAR